MIGDRVHLRMDGAVMLLVAEVRFGDGLPPLRVTGFEGDVRTAEKISYSDNFGCKLPLPWNPAGICTCR